MSGRVYAYDYNPPKVDGLDDETGDALIQREVVTTDDDLCCYHGSVSQAPQYPNF